MIYKDLEKIVHYKNLYEGETVCGIPASELIVRNEVTTSALSLFDEALRKCQKCCDILGRHNLKE